MDLEQNAADYNAMLRNAIKSVMSSMWTALPAEVVSYDPDTQTCSAQPTIRCSLPIGGAEYKTYTLPVLEDIPVIFGHGGGFAVTFPIHKGDECLLVFSSRCIDAWWQSGGVQEQAEDRQNDLSDAFAIVGPVSQPKKVSQPNDCMCINALEGNTRIDIKKDEIIIKSGSVKIEDDVTIDGKSFLNHTHEINAVAQGTAGTYPVAIQFTPFGQFVYGESGKVK